jgi:hypothetical protein
MPGIHLSISLDHLICVGKEQAAQLHVRYRPRHNRDFYQTGLAVRALVREEASGRQHDGYFEIVTRQTRE